MAKYLTNENGRMVEKMGVEASAGAGSAGGLPQLDSAGKLDSSVMPTGLGDDSQTVDASENISAPAFVNIWNDGGTPKVRAADATTEGKEVVGYITTAATTGAGVKVFFEGVSSGHSSLTIGERQYLATTAGQISATAPSGTGVVVQCLGEAISATEIAFEKSDPITLA